MTDTDTATTRPSAPPADDEGDPTSPAEPSTRGLAWLLLVGGVIGAIAAMVLTIEKIALLSDASYVPSCSLNPVLNCGSVMTTDQAEVLGFPNPLMGIAAFPVLAATGAALLAGARVRRWYWLGLQAGVTLGAVFVGWLVFQSLYRIGALCPYCMVVWAVVIPIWWAVTAHNAERGTFGERVRGRAVTRFLFDYQPVLVALTFVVVAALITVRFWDYWSTLL